MVGLMKDPPPDTLIQYRIVTAVSTYRNQDRMLWLCYVMSVSQFACTLSVSAQPSQMSPQCLTSTLHSGSCCSVNRS